MDVETQGADPITRLPKYVPSHKGKAKVSTDIGESKSSMKTLLLLNGIIFEGPHLRWVPVLKFEDWDLENHEKFLHLAIVKLTCRKRDAIAGMIKLEPQKWLKGVEKVGFLNLFWVPHYHCSLVTIFVIR